MSGFGLTLLLVVVGVVLRHVSNRRRISGILIWAGLILAAITALAMYGLRGHTQRIDAASRAHRTAAAAGVARGDRNAWPQA